VYTYLTMTSGDRAGAHYVLDPERENLIGRGLECTVVLKDPLCSRIHAVVKLDGGRWRICDANSRNGTYVNGQKIDDAVLGQDHVVRVGTHEFSFQETKLPPRSGSGTARDILVTQTIVKDTPISRHRSVSLTDTAPVSPELTRQLRTLQELTLSLLACDDPDEVVRTVVELLLQRTDASVVGFLWVADEGHLKPKLVLPESAAKSVVLSESLTELVCEKGHAVWIANQHLGEQVNSLEHFADALCIPLVSARDTLGAIHLYREADRFRQVDFDFAIEVANVVVVALVRARRQTRLEAEHTRLVKQSPGYNEMIGQSATMMELHTKIERVSQVIGCVLIRGESGAGKELVARAVHRASPRADRPMLSVNCAAIPADLMESHLFGHKKGAFTGADRDHIGYFEQADLGTLFLDEVGEMTLAGQAKLLRILEGHPFLPVGATAEVSADVRVIAATNQDLQAYVREKKFREDLYYRLSVFELHIPPLRDRGDDVELLTDFFLDHFRNERGRTDLHLSDAARAKLLGYAWPGNVRQLRNVLDSAVVLAAGDKIEVTDLMLRDVGSGELESLKIEDWERRLIGEALVRAGGSVPEAAKLLGIGRATLYRKIDEYDIER
jgi:two-component system response regulator HydG